MANDNEILLRELKQHQLEQSYIALGKAVFDIMALVPYVQSMRETGFCGKDREKVSGLPEEIRASHCHAMKELRAQTTQNFQANSTPEPEKT